MTTSCPGGFSNTRSVLVMIFSASFEFGFEFAPPLLTLPDSSSRSLTLHQMRKLWQQQPDTSSVFGEIPVLFTQPPCPRVNRTRDQAASNPSGHRERERRGGAKTEGYIELIWCVRIQRVRDDGISAEACRDTPDRITHYSLQSARVGSNSEYSGHSLRDRASMQSVRSKLMLSNISAHFHLNSKVFCVLIESHTFLTLINEALDRSWRY